MIFPDIDASLPNRVALFVLDKDIGILCDENGDNVNGVGLQGDVKRSVSVLIDGVDVGAAIKKSCEGLGVVFLSSNVKGGVSLFIGLVDLCPLVDQKRQSLETRNSGLLAVLSGDRSKTSKEE